MLKKYLILILFVSTNTWAVTSELFLSDGTKYSINKTSELISHLVEIQKEKNILIFVHGRGKHPKKGLKIIPTLEKKYDSKVIMFHWESWIDNDVRPVQNAKDSSYDLFSTLEQIQEYKNGNQLKSKDVKISLLVHSMGSLVIEEMLRRYKRGSLSKNFLETIIINQSDSEALDHHLWLANADFQKRLFVTNNSNDFILHKSIKIDPGHRLGLGLEVNNRREFSYASNAIYLDMTQIVKKKHRIYLLSNSKKHRDVNHFYSQTILGDQFQLSKVNKIYRKSNNYEAYEFHQK